jgi:hypothetical protein
VDDLTFDPPSNAAELVASLDRVGLSTPTGLETVSDVWEAFAPDRDAYWQEVEALSVETLERLIDAHGEPVDDGDLARILRTWTFPLWHVELDRIKVDLDEPRRRQLSWHPDL